MSLCFHVCECAFVFGVANMCVYARAVFLCLLFVLPFMWVHVCMGLFVWMHACHANGHRSSVRSSPFRRNAAVIRGARNIAYSRSVIGSILGAGCGKV